ncbi:MAG: phytanoyl-CoA dioxygenase family protein [Kangiellaceae bacterium]|jgi:phytanoyl-CoA hydroxylase|nr:phytanoyl-CoA dioxygenase family protein [Kangiellaceae bacterium]
MLTPQQISLFNSQGYLVLKQFCPASVLQQLNLQVKQELDQRIEPLELESTVGYPGAPATGADGDHTIRRLLTASDRDPVYREWACYPKLKAILTQLLPSSPILVRAHHNCVMTKHPHFSSDSWWHQDLRYWNYSEGNLISAWTALGTEHIENGCLQVIPGSHRLAYSAEQFDQQKFFRQDLALNQPILQQALPVELEAGDTVLFHCRLLHAARRNSTEHTKKATVFTYRSDLDQPLPNTRSSSINDIEL